MLRRTKAVVGNLPPKRIFVCKIQMTKYQKQIMESLYPRLDAIKTTKQYTPARQMCSSLKTWIHWKYEQQIKIPEEIRMEIASHTMADCSGV